MKCSNTIFCPAQYSAMVTIQDAKLSL